MAEQQNSQGGKTNQNINQAIYGLNMDSIPEQVKPGTLTYALNAMVENFDGHMISYQNEGSNVLCRDFKTGYRVIGIHNIIEQNRTVLFLVNPDTHESEIGFLDNTVNCDYNDTTGLGDIKSNNYVNNGYNNIDLSVPCNCVEEDQPEILSFYEAYQKTLTNNTTTFRGECCKYTTIINAKCLNFNVANPIHKAVHRIIDQLNDGKCGTEVYWTDGLNPRRFINLDDLPYKELVTDCDRIKTNEVDCSLLNVEPVFTIPSVVTTETVDGGALIAGAYQFAISYVDNNGQSYTSYYSITNPVNIFETIVGLDYNFPTNKSIKLVISNLDTKFEFFNLAVIKTINGVADVELVGTFDITSDHREIIYTGSNKTQINLNMDDIFDKKVNYSTANVLSVINNTLAWADLKGRKKINYQSIASRIKLQWQTIQLPYNKDQGYTNGVNSALYRGYMRDEVYGLEFVPIIEGGIQECGFHIPGRIATCEDITSVTNDDVICKSSSCEEKDRIQYACNGTEVDEYVGLPSSNCSLERYKVYNTATKIGLTTDYILEEDKSCYIGPYEYGEFGYHESTALYPCNEKVWGDLAGKPIRHHRMPDNIITHIYNKNPNPLDETFEHKIFPLGIRIDLENVRQAILQSDLTDAEKSKIIGYKILRTDRVNNKSVVAKGLLFNMGKYTKKGQSYTYPNYPFNDLGGDPFLTKLDSVNNNNSSFDVSLLNNFESSLDSLQQQSDTLKSLLSQVSSVNYTSDGTSATGTIIQIVNSDLNSLDNLILLMYNATVDLIGNINTIQTYVDTKVENNQPFCKIDIASLTINTVTYNNYITTVNNLLASTTITNFDNIVTYVNTNAIALNSNPNSTAIFSLKTKLVDILSVANSISANKIESVTRKDVYDNSLSNTTDGLITISCVGVAVPSSNFSATRLTFHSPDTHFYQPFLGDILKLETVEGGKAKGNFVEVQEHARNKLMSLYSSNAALAAGTALGVLFAADLKPFVVGGFTAIATVYLPVPSLGTIAEKIVTFNALFKDLIQKLIPYKNYAYQYNAVGNYSTFEPIANNGFKIRSLQKRGYLLPGVQSVGDTNPVNNWHRESSVFLKTDTTGSSLKLPNNPIVRKNLKEDNSRVKYSDDAIIYSDILSYYGSIKRKLLDQYGEMYSYNALDTGYHGQIDIEKDYTGKTDTIFGGDIFINQFALKRKLSYFLSNLVGKPEGTDVEYSMLSNIGKVRYWYNTSSTKVPGTGIRGLIKTIMGVPQSNLDDKTDKLFYQNGKIYLFSYGIVNYFVESEVNIEHRQAGNFTDKNFYPNVGTGIPNDWLQEVTVPIVHDNYYIYNKTYSKQNKENVFCHLLNTFDPNETCLDDYSHRIIISDPNKWKLYKPISFYRLPKTYGKLIDINNISNGEVLVRFENKSKIYNAMTSIQTSSGKYAYLGNDDVFNEQRAIDFGETDLGFAGSQNKLFLKTEAGSLFSDVKRGTIFLLNGKTPEVITDRMMSKWFGNNLPFNISKDFPNVNTDNHFNGIGITGVWDVASNRFVITKLDYELTDPTVKYDETTGKFYITKELTTLVQKCCPDNYERVDNNCVYTIKVPAIPNGDPIPFTVCRKSSAVYSIKGSWIYTSFNQDGTGSSAQISTSNPYWINSPVTSTTKGPMNRTCIWRCEPPVNGDDLPVNKWVSVVVSFNSPKQKTYYIGIAGDNNIKVKLNCNTLVDFTSGGYDNNLIAFERWHLYPITIPAGLNYLELSGLNRGIIAGFGATIYDNTAAELVSAQSDSDLNILFTTKSLAGQTLSNFNFTCPDGSCGSMIKENGKTYCVTSSTVPVDCVDISKKTIIKTEVLLQDPKYFCNRSWTISYSPIIKAWVSYHSYLPNYYIGQSDHFKSGVNGTFNNSISSIWNHGLTHTSFQTFYGKLEPYILEYPFVFKYQDEILQNVKDYTTILEYYNHQDFYEINDGVYFNKAVLYNNQQCSGIRNLHPKPKGKLSLYFNYPKTNSDSIDIIYTKSDNFFNYNQIWDVVKNPNNHNPIWNESCINKSIDRELNNTKFDYSNRSHQKTKLRAKNLKVRHIQDLHSRYKFISKFVNSQTQTSQK